jgi:hypothetical protein
MSILDNLKQLSSAIPSQWMSNSVILLRNNIFRDGKMSFLCQAAGYTDKRKNSIDLMSIVDVGFRFALLLEMKI